MAIESPLNGSRAALTTFDQPPTTKTTAAAAQSSPDLNRRNSLPLQFLPPNLWSASISSASLVESEEAARGEHILDEASVAHRISALRQLNGAARFRHRYSKSTGARNSTFSQPVIVRTYSGASRPPRSEQRDLITVKSNEGWSAMKSGKMELKLPPVEAFSFKGIMDEIKSGVSEDLERIAEICARSKYSLSNQYEVHMPPHGRREPSVQAVGLGVRSQTSGLGPTLQAVPSDDEQPRPVRGQRRRTKSVAYGTLETIMSSSRSSDEDKSKKKPAAVLAEEVRGRAAKKELELSKEAVVARDSGPEPRPSKHVRSKSASFAAVIIDNAQGVKGDTSSQVFSPTSLVSEAARPQTSTATMLEGASSSKYNSPTLQSMISVKPSLIRNESRSFVRRPRSDSQHSVLSGLTSWLPWKISPATSPVTTGRVRSASHAEGSLRELLKATEIDKKGKSVDRSG